MVSPTIAWKAMEQLSVGWALEWLKEALDLLQKKQTAIISSGKLSISCPEHPHH